MFIEKLPSAVSGLATKKGASEEIHTWCRL